MNKKSTGETCLVLAGMVVWSTGVGTRPVIKDFMEHVGQGNRRVLETDEWLCVKGCNDVFAIGDCATIYQRKVMGHPVDGYCLWRPQSIVLGSLLDLSYLRNL
ncbi:hypothetical protein Droror1_Dr00024135 [Drosera rotundifolia]